MSRIIVFVRNALIGAGLIVVILLVWVSVGGVSEWFDETIQRAVRKALRETPQAVSSSVERRRPRKSPMRASRTRSTKLFGMPACSFGRFMEVGETVAKVG